VARETANGVAAQRHTVNLADAAQAIGAARATLSIAAKRNAGPAELSGESNTDEGSRA
jgi:hypothetical protein